MLSEVEIKHYQDEGYVIPDYQLPHAIVEGMREELECLLDRNPQLTADSLFVPHAPKNNSQGMNASNPEKWLDFACHRDILEMVADLIGEDIILWGTTVFGKPAHTGKATPWHQDGQYWPIRPLASCTAWIAIDEVDTGNGCMRVVPGSHKGSSVLKHHTNQSSELTLNQELDADQFDEDAGVDIILRPGQLSLHDINIVHGSRNNTSHRRRAGYVLRFMPATSLFDRDLGAHLSAESGVVDFTQRALFLVRGQDRAGNDLNIGHPSL